MNEIEELARPLKYIQRYGNETDSVYLHIDDVKNLINEQKAIDIEKACEWLENNADRYYQSSSQADDCWFDSDSLINDFKKAMEE